MSRYINYNANPVNNRVGDCVIRAISKVLNQDWDTTYAGICLEGFIHYDMPSSNFVWSQYMARKGFRRKSVETDVLTINEFCESHPKGSFLLCTDGHVVASIDGSYCDTWDSGNEIILYFWERKED